MFWVAVNVATDKEAQHLYSCNNSDRHGGAAAAASTNIVVVLRLNSGFETTKKGLKKKI